MSKDLMGWTKKFWMENGPKDPDRPTEGGRKKLHIHGTKQLRQNLLGFGRQGKRWAGEGKETYWG